MTEAVKWFEKAVEGNDPVSFSHYGMLLYKGEMVEKDEKKAFELFERGASLGNSSCLAMLGRMFEKGQFVEKNLPRAVEYYKEASAKLEPFAMNQLGSLKTFPL